MRLTVLLFVAVDPQRRTAADYLTDLEYRADHTDGQYLVPSRYKARCRIGRGGRLWLDRIPVSVITNRRHADRRCTIVVQFFILIACITVLCPHQVYDADDDVDEERAIHIYPTSLPYQYPEGAYSLLQACTAATAAPGGLPSPSVGVRGPASINGSVAEGQEGSVDGSQYGGAASANGATGTATAPLPELPLSNARNYFGALRARLHPQNQLGNHTHDSNAPVGFSSYNTNMTVQQRQRLSRLPRMPACSPAAQVVIPPYKAARLAAILAASDSEDERPLFPKYRRGEDFGEFLHWCFVLIWGRGGS